MANAVTPSENISIAKVGKLQELLGAALRKSGIPDEPSQTVIETQGKELVDEWVASFRTRVDAVSKTIRRVVRVDRTKTSKQILDATGYVQYTDADVVESMSKGEGEEVEVCFFNLDRFVSDARLDREYELRGLKPCDPYSLAKVNELEPSFANKHPNGTHWKDSKGRWCYVAFHRLSNERSVSVNRHGEGWFEFWWFAGLRK